MIFFLVSASVPIDMGAPSPALSGSVVARRARACSPGHSGSAAVRRQSSPVQATEEPYRDSGDRHPIGRVIIGAVLSPPRTAPRRPRARRRRLGAVVPARAAAPSERRAEPAWAALLPAGDHPGGAHGVEPDVLPPGLVHGHPGVAAGRRGPLDEGAGVPLDDRQPRVGQASRGRRPLPRRRLPDQGDLHDHARPTRARCRGGDGARPRSSRPARARTTTPGSRSAASPRATGRRCGRAGSWTSTASGCARVSGRARCPGKGSGIFYHTSKPGHPWAPTAGCTQVGNPRQMRWLLTWLRPEAQPRVVQNR